MTIQTVLDKISFNLKKNVSSSSSVVFTSTSDSILMNSSSQTNIAWNYYSISYSIYLNRSDSCFTTISDTLSCKTAIISSTMVISFI